ncbi:hypothetical protein P691DRAFT_788228 [Macrolepiota fuliginosa MF-IS2]|uniref:Uncharacterized protein n=1 Tax=Macrolepiota fuliginosa MF-IS2 TaxID=1400762 RepID=A0A9P6BZ54_9AGAR|nr:hypothetical protein P691DRAFT_788228 [Macrolepiota fuliginosa MF-IS2]
MDPYLLNTEQRGISPPPTRDQAHGNQPEAGRVGGLFARGNFHNEKLDGTRAETHHEDAGCMHANATNRLLQGERRQSYTNVDVATMATSLVLVSAPPVKSALYTVFWGKATEVSVNVERIYLNLYPPPIPEMPLATVCKPSGVFPLPAITRSPSSSPFCQTSARDFGSVLRSSE